MQCGKEKCKKVNFMDKFGKQREATAPIQSLVKQQPRFLSLQWKICLRQNCSLDSCACSEGPALGLNTDDDDDGKKKE